MPHRAELVVDAQAIIGEGPMWDAHRQVLYWIDIVGKKFHIYDPSSDSDSVFDMDQMPGTVVLRRSGGLMVAMEGGFAAFDPQSQALDFWSDPESDKPINRFNDGKCDPAGRFWAGTMPYKGDQPSGKLYCLDTDRSVRPMVDDITISNGLTWSHDGKTMYYIDSTTRRVDAFDYDQDTGDITNRRTIVATPHEWGVPDGMTIDEAGNLWVAFFGGSGVACWDPRTGKQVDWVDVPASQITACWFGGGDLDQLFITSGRRGLDSQALQSEPHAGGLFVASVGVNGTPASEYGG